MDNILDSIRDHLRRYIVFPTDQLELIVALWIIHTHTFMESFPRTPWVTPYLYIYSETPGAGKTTVIRVLHSLVYNPEIAGDMTSAAMFTLISGTQDDDDSGEIASIGRPTLLIDEIDTVFKASGSGNMDLRRTLNTGYEQNGYAVRKVGKSAVKYSTFCAKLLAGIKGLSSELPETIRTRSIPVPLVKATPAERYYAHKAGPDAAQVAERISEWVRANGAAIIDYEPDEIDAMEPRAFEISFPLLQLAHTLGVEDAAREALIDLLTPPTPKDSPEVALLRAVRDCFDNANADKLHSATICDYLNSTIGAGWNGKLFGNRMRQFEIGSPTPFNIGGKTLKGYYRYQFEAAWTRYL